MQCRIHLPQNRAPPCRPPSTYATDKDLSRDPYALGEDDETSRPAQRFMLDVCAPVMMMADAEEQFEADLEATTDQFDDEMSASFDDYDYSDASSSNL